MAVAKLSKILAVLVPADLTVLDTDYSQYVNLLYVFLSALKFFYSCILFSEGTAGGGNMFPGVVAGKTIQMNT